MKTNLVAIACDVVGGMGVLSRLLGVSAPTVSQWKSGVRPIPIERCAAIEKITGGKVTRQEMRPKDWHLIWPELTTPKKRMRA